MTNSYDPMMADSQDMSQNVRNITNQVDTSNIQSVPLSMFKSPIRIKKK
jgi:hypothetical protein